MPVRARYIIWCGVKAWLAPALSSAGCFHLRTSIPVNGSILPGWTYPRQMPTNLESLGSITTSYLCGRIKLILKWKLT